MNISLVFSLLVVVVLMLCMIWLLLIHEKLKRQYEALAESFYRVQELNGELRGQRHDYLNHLQIVYGMMELEEYEELHDYLEPIYKDMMKVGKAIRTSIPAVNALLMAKMGTAEANGIDFYVEVKSDLKMSLDISEDRDFYLFAVSNNGPVIPEEKRGVIFRQGFTTKKEEGHGMGLYIVAGILKENRGTIQLDSDEKETVFTVRFAKEAKA